MKNLQDIIESRKDELFQLLSDLIKFDSQSTGVDGKEKERYPLYDYIEQNGRNEGFHPDTEVAYIRTLWKDFEPEEGKFNPFTDEDYAYPLRTVLSDGDVVNFDADYHPKPAEGEPDSGKISIPHATIDWFADVNTERGKNCLIRYFKDKYPEK